MTTKLTHHLLSHFHFLQGEKFNESINNVEVANAKGSLPRVVDLC